MHDGRHDDRTAAVDPGRVLRFTSLRVGATFARRYEIRERIGSGGFAEVYRAHDRIGDVECALKVLFPRNDESRSLARLRRELRAVRDLSHPGVVRVYEVGEHDGLLYLALELLRGESLRRRLDREATPPAGEAVRIAAGLLDALAAAHAAGVVHRDVTPSNVFLERSGRIVLLDFGLARTVSDATLTATGQLVGTAAYASPEQALGRPATPASDVYGAGVVLWELLCGGVPFTGDSQVDVLNGHLRRPLPALPPLARRAPRRVRRLVRWMLEKEPRHRPADAGEASAALRDGRRGAMVRFRTRQAARAVLSRWPLLAAGVVAAALVALVPVRVETDGNRLEGVTALGLRRPTIELSSKIVDVATWPAGGLARRRLVLMTDAYGGRVHDDYPDRLATVDLLTGRVRPGSLGDASPLEVDLFAGRFDARWKGRRLTPFRLPDGHALVVEYGHRNHYPYLLVVLRDDTNSRPMALHPGHVESLVVVPGPDGRPLIVADAVNNLLGNRRALMILDPTARLHRDIGLPPIQRQPVGPGNWVRSYTALGVSSMAVVAMRVDPDAGRVTFDLLDGSQEAFRIEDGAPATEAGREHRSLDDWRAAQSLLLDALEEGEHADRDGRYDDAVRQALRVPDDPRTTSTQRAVALGRAAHFALRAGRPARALELARSAHEIEPDVAGHLRGVVVALTRLGRFDEIDELRARTETVTDRHGEMNQDFMFARLIARPDAPPRDIGSLDDGGNAGYGHLWFESVLHLHRGELDDVLAVLDEHRAWSELPEWQFLDAMARLLGPDTPDIERHEQPIDVRAAGSGQTLPLKSLRYLEALRLGERSPDADEIRAELERQRFDARWNVVDLYFLAWGEALARHVGALDTAARPDDPIGDLERRVSRLLAAAPRPAGPPAE